MPAMATPNNRTGISDPGYNMREVASLTAAILAMRSALAPERALLVGISGIDGSGKGFVTAQLAERLRALDWNVAAVSADDWLNLPDVWINHDDPAEHFYKHAVRFDEMFERLVLPLKQSRRVDLVADCGDAKATIHRKHRYRFRNIDIILLEGIFLFKSAYRHQFDLKGWIDCSFETALERAIARGQEGLPPAETKKAFETIYFPAQQIHLARDHPREAADIVFPNDSPQRYREKRNPCSTVCRVG
jgi:uridine kinase